MSEQINHFIVGAIMILSFYVATLDTKEFTEYSYSKLETVIINSYKEFLYYSVMFSDYHILIPFHILSKFNIASAGDIPNATTPVLVSPYTARQ